jgi:DNA-binding NtrC family response regulator
MMNKAVRVLVVDDEEEYVAHLVKRLAARGYAARGVNSGEEALEVARSNAFDVAVLDIAMPGIDGVETLAALKRLQPTVQVIMLTGHGSVNTAFESGKHDACCFLNKPCAYDDLLREIHNAAERRRLELREEYEEELRSVLSSGSTAREILSDSEALRKKYEQ